MDAKFLILGLRQMGNMKILKLLLEIQHDLKNFYRSNDPESVLGIESINTIEKHHENERN